MSAVSATELQDAISTTLWALDTPSTPVLLAGAVPAFQGAGALKSLASLRLAGSAEAIDGAAKALGSLARDLEARADVLQHASGGLSDAVVGSTGLSLTDATDGLEKLTRLQVKGLEMFADALADQAELLRGAQRAIAAAGESLAGEVARAESLVIQARQSAPLALANQSSALPDPLQCSMVSTGLCDVADSIRASIGTMRTECVSVLDGAKDFARLADDAQGHFRLAGIRWPTGMGVLDVVAARAETFNNDPDASVLSDVEWARFVTCWDSLTPAERDELVAAWAQAEPLSRTLAMSALASGAPVGVVVTFVNLLAEATPQELEEIAGLRTFLDSGGASAANTRFEQYTDTTCGPTTIVALIAAGDPLVAYWMVTGTTVGDYVPPFLKGIDLAKSGTEPADRITFLEESVQDRVNSWKWIDQLGIPPAPAASEMGRSGTPYDLRWAPDVKAGQLVGVLPGAIEPMPLSDSLDQAERALNAGTPVPLLVGEADGWLPRHYVLAVGYSDGKFAIFDPGNGKTDTLTKDELMTRDTKRDPLGNWPRVFAVYVPALRN